MIASFSQYTIKLYSRSDLRLKDESYIEAFWERVRKSEPEDCWIWEGSVTIYGYGSYSTKNPLGFNSTQAHRISYFLANGDFDRSLEICHSCDNRLCVNPKHLSLGSRSDNMQDMSKKKRQWLQLNPERQQGENNNSAKLNWEKVKEIRLKYSNGGVTGKELAVEYGVGVSTMYQILSKKTWKEE